MESKDQVREGAGCAREECFGRFWGQLVSGKRSGFVVGEREVGGSQDNVWVFEATQDELTRSRKKKERRTKDDEN